MLAATAIHVAPASAASSSFNGIVVEARLVTIDTATDRAVVRVDPSPSGSFTEGELGLLTRDVVLYTTSTTGAIAHSYRAHNFMDPFEATVPLEGNTSTYPFQHFRVAIAALATTGGGLRSGRSIPVELQVSNKVPGHRVTSQSTARQEEVVQVTLQVEPSWPAVAFAVFIMVVMWALALAAISVAVNLVRRRRKFEGAFTAFLATLLFAFPTVRNNLPGIPPVGVLFDYAAFFWAEALVALSLIALVTGWTLRHLIGTSEPPR